MSLNFWFVKVKLSIWTLVYNKVVKLTFLLLEWRKMHSTYKARRIIISCRFGITIGLKDRISRYDLILQRLGFNGIVLFGRARSNIGKVLDNLFSVLGLTSSRLSTLKTFQNYFKSESLLLASKILCEVLF